MKKITLLLSFSLLVTLTLPLSRPLGDAGKILLLGSTAAWAASPQAGEEKKPQWKSREEYDAYQAMGGEQDPQKKIALAEAFLNKFADSDFKDLVYFAMMQAYQQLGNVARALEAGKKGLEANPDNLDVLTLDAYLFPFGFKADDAGASSELSRAESNAKHGLAILEKTQKPEGVSEDQFSQAIKARRAVFSNLAGFVALQRKDYPAAIASLRVGVEDNPADVGGNYRLGVAYVLSSPPDYNNGFWCLARSVALARAARAANVADIENYLKQSYVNYHGNEEGLADIIAQAAASPTPPEGFVVEAVKPPEPTGNPNVDGFNTLAFPLKLGGDRAQKAWSQLKGQPLGLGGFVDSVEKGTDANTYLVRIDILNKSREADGVYDIELKDSTQPNVRNLSKGDIVRFEGKIEAYKTEPSFVLTLGAGKINPEDVPDQPTRRTRRRP